MIQPALPPSPLPAALPVDSLLPGGAMPAEAPDFAAFLATSLGAEPAATHVEPALPAEATPQVSGASEAATGKVLPPALPEIAACAAEPEIVSTPDAAPAPKSVRPHLAMKTVPATRTAVRKDGKPNEADAPKDDAVELVEAKSHAVLPQPVDAAPAPAPAADQRPAPIALAASQTPHTETEPTAPTDEKPANPDLPSVPARAAPVERALVQAAPQAEYHRLANPAPPAAQADARPAAPIAEPQPRAPVQLRVEIAQPPAVQASSATPRPAARRIAPVEDLTEAAPFAAPAVPPQAALPVSAPVATAAVRPHDFAALVDRLVAAREAVQPQAATLTVAHADFGPVALHFRHEERGLAVSLASADPDFARAAAAAPLPVMPASAGAAAQGESGQSSQHQQSGFAATTSSSGGQPRGQQGERRGEQFTHTNQHQRSAVSQSGERRSGIFA